MGTTANKAAAGCKIAVGTLMVASVAIGYLPQPQYMVELTCISNTLGGLLLLVDGVRSAATGKTCPGFLYANVAVAILVVLLICMGSLTGAYRFNFDGAFFFLHVVNPIALVACYLLFVDERDRAAKLVLTTPALTVAYLLFDYVRCQLVGEFVYGFVDPAGFTLAHAAVAGILAYTFACLLGLGLFALNRLVHAKRRLA